MLRGFCCIARGDMVAAVMRMNRDKGWWLVAVCVVLAACAGGSRASSVNDLYSIPSPSAGQPSPLDNDSYYLAPAVYKGCATINEAPSCGGG